MASGRAKLQDVAERAGVSRSTASRALGGYGYTAEGVRARVLKAAAELGYVPNVAARSLRQESVRLIGIAVSSLLDPFYAEFASAAGARAKQRGYQVLLANFGAETGARGGDELAALEALVSLRVAGVVGTPGSPELAKHLAENDVLLVEADRRFSDATDSVTADNYGAATNITEHLLRLGHSKIALFIDEVEWSSGRDRQRGYRDALSRAGVPASRELSVQSGIGAEEAKRHATNMLMGHDRPTAVVAANSVLAEAVWRSAHELELTIPGDLALASFDDAPWMSMVSPGVTAVATQAQEMGLTAVDLLLSRIQEPDSPIRAVTIPTSIALRGSTASGVPASVATKRSA